MNGKVGKKKNADRMKTKELKEINEKKEKERWKEKNGEQRERKR